MLYLCEEMISSGNGSLFYIMCLGQVMRYNFTLLEYTDKLKQCIGETKPQCV